MKLIAALTAVVLAAAPALAQGPDSAFFGALTSFRLSARTSLAPAVAGKPAVQGKPKASRYVTVGGPLSLSGQGFVSQPNGWVTVTLSGWLTVQDASGRVVSQNQYVTTTASFMASGGWVNGTVFPSEYVTLLVDGKPARQALVNGAIFVSGFVSGGWVNVAGSGTLTGSALVD